MCWYKVTLSREQIVAGEHMRMVEACRPFFMQHRRRGAAVFTKFLPEFPTSYFFSPAAVLIAKKVIDDYAGTECPAPMRDELALTFGDAGALSSPEIPFADKKE